MSDDQWHGFLERALWGLEQAAERLREDKTRARMEAAGDWWRKATRSGPLRGVKVPEETAVSGALQELFDEVCSDQQICGHGGMDLRHFQFHAERRRKRDPNMGRGTKPTDIAIILRDDVAYDLRIEAKTLVREAEIKAEYLSDRGLLRFEDSGNPYTTEPFGGMIAYVVEDDIATWADRIHTGLQTELGDSRVGHLAIGKNKRVVSQHSYEVVEDGSHRIQTVAVLHMIAEIEARPSQRMPDPNSDNSIRV